MCYFEGEPKPFGCIYEEPARKTSITRWPLRCGDKSRAAAVFDKEV
jgi:hypothetical protein